MSSSATSHKIRIILTLWCLHKTQRQHVKVFDCKTEHKCTWLLFNFSIWTSTRKTIAKILFSGFLCLALRNSSVLKGKLLYTFSSYIFYIPFYCPLFNIHNIEYPTRHINTFIYNTSKPKKKKFLIISVFSYLVSFAFPHHLKILACSKLHLFSYH